MLRDRDVHQVRRRLDRAIAGRLASDLQRFDRLRRRLEARDLRRVAGVLATRLAQARGRLDAAMTRRRLVAAARAATLSGRLDALSPLSVLARGYAVCWNEAHDSIIRSSAAVGPGDAVQVTLAEGELACRVERVLPGQSQ
jgi:exodeoxyribonuclease VII large subunit